jgi:ArsR family transcriptional regulator
MQESDSLRQFAERLRMMGDPVRIRITKLLDNRELSVGEIATVLDLPQPTVSRKLGELRRAGVLRYRKDAKNIFYSWSKEFSQSQLRLVIMTTQTPEFLNDLTSLERLNTLKKGGSKYILR